MAHGIVTPYDQVLSTTSKEWHGLATVVERIDDSTVEPLLFPIIEGETYVRIGDQTIKVPNRKTLVADLRGRSVNPDAPFYLEPDDNLIPMHSPKDSYQPIPNRDIWDGLKVAIAHTGGKIVTAGTFNCCQKFFISVDIGHSESLINGDEFNAYLNFVTSHDGTLAAQAHDSQIRQVCRNTVMQSLQLSGDIGFKVYHTKNAPVVMEKFSELLNAVLQGRVTFKNQMEYLASVGITFDQAKHIALAFLSEDKKFPSHQAHNMALEIQDTFKNGMGNKGKTLYDLFNAFTETYTHGSGVGKKSSAEEKTYKANFGKAADRKTEFTNHLLGINLEEQSMRGLILAEEYARRN